MIDTPKNKNLYFALFKKLGHSTRAEKVVALKLISEGIITHATLDLPTHELRALVRPETYIQDPPSTLEEMNTLIWRK